jgi:hypothetical protein
MFKRRRQTKKLVQIARMLQELDTAASRPGSPGRRDRIALSRF